MNYINNFNFEGQARNVHYGKTGHVRARARQCHEITRVRSIALVRHFCFLHVSSERAVKRTHTGLVMLLKTVIIVLVVML